MSQKGVYSIMKDSTKIVVMKVILSSETCLTGKIATLVLGASVEIAPQRKQGMSALSRSGGGARFKSSGYIWPESSNNFDGIKS